ncbi:MAG: hypothetical protein B7Y25_02935 [Alphaproteobacteria bacterium 16-39-46]|nr:MAG: hypothetical protein B7Y25_02935 [Alphaproteobacteria bacterium 16-39-46]OZA43473.1 MAG: hypothetical protein B7X84_03070 [Alphaproteobacteria bacterium 17-39-52]HQS84451.1 hypothetical protein [Alphaproteobacteria bacterium]HQS94234.1 hypothetical protein [Alphaproteobacteria bacterium]
MRMRLIGMAVAGALFSGSTFAMEAFEQGDFERIRTICQQKIQEFDGKHSKIAEKFDTLLLLCLDENSFYESLSNGSYASALEVVKPYLLGGAVSSASGDYQVSADAEMARQLHLKFKGASVKDTAQRISDAELARRLQEQFYIEEGEKRERLPAACAGAESEPVGFFAKIQENPRFEEMRRRIAPIFRHIESLPAMGDVHMLDGYVSRNMSGVVEIGGALEMGKPNLSFEDVKINLKQYFQENPIKMALNGEAISLDTFLGYVDSVFQSDFKSQGPLFQELVSRSWSFAIAMRDEELRRTGKFEDRFLIEIASGIVENYVTGGGCLAGRVNRFFAAYVRMIHYAVNDSK